MVVRHYSINDRVVTADEYAAFISDLLVNGWALVLRRRNNG